MFRSCRSTNKCFRYVTLRPKGNPRVCIAVNISLSVVCVCRVCAVCGCGGCACVCGVCGVWCVYVGCVRCVGVVAVRVCVVCVWQAWDSNPRGTADRIEVVVPLHENQHFKIW